VVEIRHPIGPAGVEERRRHRVEVSGALGADRAAGTAERAGPVLPVLRLLEQGQDGVEVPASVAGLGPGVVVGPVPACPYHGIDAARPTEHLAERQPSAKRGDGPRAYALSRQQAAHLGVAGWQQPVMSVRCLSRPSATARGSSWALT